MNEVLMIPPEEMGKLMNLYKERFTGDPYLTKATRLAAESHKVLESKKIPPGIKKARVKMLAPKISGALRKYKKGPLNSDIIDAPHEEQTKAFQQLLKSILKGNKKKTISTPTGIKKRKKKGEVEKLLPSPDWLHYSTRTRNAQKKNT